MNKIVLLFSLICLTSIVHGQENSEEENSTFGNLSVGILSNGTLFNFNYEQMFFFKTENFLATSVGFGVGGKDFSPFGGTDQFSCLPHHTTYNIRKRNKCFEMGYGGLWVMDDSDFKEEPTYLPNVTLGYRVQKKISSRSFFRIVVNVPVVKVYSILYSPVGVHFGATL